VIVGVESSTVDPTKVRIRYGDAADFGNQRYPISRNQLGELRLINSGALFVQYSPNGTTIFYSNSMGRDFSDSPIQYLQSPGSRRGLIFDEFDSSTFADFGRLESSDEVGSGYPIFAGERARAYCTETISEGVTDFPGVDHLIESVISFTLRSLMSNPQEEIFEDGMESELSRKLHAMIRGFGLPCVELLGEILMSNTINCEVASEVLRQVGLIEHPQTHSERLLLLTSALKFEDPRLRDAASIGLASMDDPAALSALEAAILVEPSSAIRRNLNQVVKQFQAA
jgi:hypothetical protein